MPGKVVLRHLDRPSGPKLVKMPDQQIRLQRIGMIVVEGGPLFQAQIVPVPVIAVVFEHSDLVVADAFDDAADDGRLPRAGTARDSDDERGSASRGITIRVLRSHDALTASGRLAKRRQPSAACSMPTAQSSSTCSTVPWRCARCLMRSRLS